MISIHNQVDANRTGIVNRPFFSSGPRPPVPVPTAPGIPDSLFVMPNASAAYRGYKPHVQYFEKPAAESAPDPLRDPDVRRRFARRNLPLTTQKALENIDKLRAELLKTPNASQGEKVANKLLIGKELTKAMLGMSDPKSVVNWSGLAQQMETKDYVGFGNSIKQTIGTPGVSDADKTALGLITSDAVAVEFMAPLSSAEMQQLLLPPPGPGDGGGGGGDVSVGGPGGVALTAENIQPKIDAGTGKPVDTVVYRLTTLEIPKGSIKPSKLVLHPMILTADGKIDNKAKPVKWFTDNAIPEIDGLPKASIVKQYMREDRIFVQKGNEARYLKLKSIMGL